MHWNGTPVVVAPLACAGALLAVALAAGGSSGRVAQDAAAPPADQLILTRGVETGPMSRSVELLRARLRALAAAKAAGGELRQEVRPLPAPKVANGTREFAGHLGLAVYRALAEARAPAGFALDFFEGSGVLRAFGFDARRGVEATFAIKIENDKGAHGGKEEGEEREAEEDELDAQARRAIDGMVAALALEEQAADAPDDAPDDESARWLGDEDSPEFGFRWEYLRSGAEQLAQVTFVFENGSLGKAGLQRGDRVLTVNGESVATPPRFGHAVGGLRAGAPLALEVRRGAATVALKGSVERAAAIVPAWEQQAVGARLPPFRATIGGAPVEVGAAAPALVTVVCLFDPRRPDTLRDAALLAWLRDHHPPDQVAVAGIAVHADDARVKAVMEELACGWPTVADPDGRLAEATRTITLPALLLADRDGVVRHRRACGGALQHALRQLLAAKH